MPLKSARQRFVAALALYLVWVGTLVAMAVTTAERPAAKPAPAPAGGEPAREAAPLP
jgi:hypothetical protein